MIFLLTEHFIRKLRFFEICLLTYNLNFFYPHVDPRYLYYPVYVWSFPTLLIKLFSKNVLWFIQFLKNYLLISDKNPYCGSICFYADESE